MNEDNDLKRMFEAIRNVDDGLVPSFDQFETESAIVRTVTPVASESVSLSVPVAMLAIMTSVIIGLAVWIANQRPDEMNVSSASQAELMKLNQVCDSLLARLNDPDSELTPGILEPEMYWPTETDSLMPFETLSFNLRTLP